MPRVKKNQWTDGAAKEAVGSGMSIRGAALKYGIPKSTLQDHLKGKSTKSGMVARALYLRWQRRKK